LCYQNTAQRDSLIQETTRIRNLPNCTGSQERDPKRNLECHREIGFTYELFHAVSVLRRYSQLCMLSSWEDIGCSGRSNFSKVFFTHYKQIICTLKLLYFFLKKESSYFLRFQGLKVYLPSRNFYLFCS
jgi:hypothetical protein